MQKNILDALEIILETKSRHDIALKQSLRYLESYAPDHYAKALMLKILPLLTANDRKWMKDLY